MTPSRRRGVVEHLRTAYRVSERRACRATGFHRSTQRYRARRDPQVELRTRLKGPAMARVRYGYRRPHVPLRREGWPVNARRVHRLCREEGLSIRPRTPRRRRSCRYRAERPAAGAPNDCRAMDFVSDALFGGSPFRILAVVDVHTREALAIVPRAGFRAFRVVEVLDRLAAERGGPRAIEVDDGPGFAGKTLDRWAYLNGVGPDFSRPGKPTGNARIEAFNARLRAERPNASRFLSMADARDRIEAWRIGHDEERPHTALGSLTPREFTTQAHPARRVA